ncbi:MAG: glutathione synthase [Porcipelethomonas sp.]
MKHPSYMFDGQFGLERETLRVDRNGRLAQTPHPFDDVHLSRDFCENQLEIITPVCKSIGETMSSLEQLDRRARERLATDNEYIWLYSNPPHIDSESEIPIARYEGSLSAKRDYRLNLERRYGKRLMLYSGIHFNFSFSETFLRELYRAENNEVSFAEFKNALYFRLLKQASCYSWLPVLLTAASPVYDLSFDGSSDAGAGFDGHASMRSGRRGYWNQFVPELDYSGIDAYIRSIRRYVEKGVLFSPGELYLPVRLKPRGENTLEALLENGIDHIELRMFDLNPLEPLGISQKDLEFAHILLIYLLSLDDFDFSPEMQAEAIKNHKSAAAYDLGKITIDGVNILEAASRILESMSSFFADDDKVSDIIAYEKGKLSGVRICEIVKERADSGSIMNFTGE